MKKILLLSILILAMSSMASEEHIPLWKFQPDADRYSVGWRMGEGEDYVPLWWEYYNSLSPDEKTGYQEKHPEPESWLGFYADKHPRLNEKYQKILKDAN